MLDLVEGAKIIRGRMSTGVVTSAVYADWINTENVHCVWAVCSAGAQGAKTGTIFSGWAANSNAGAGAARAACQYWRTTSVTVDKFVASTQTTGLKVEDAAVGGMVVMRYDPATRSASSQKFFSVNFTSGESPIDIIYITQPRYKGLGQIRATS